MICPRCDGEMQRLDCCDELVCADPECDGTWYADDLAGNQHRMGEPCST